MTKKTTDGPVTLDEIEARVRDYAQARDEATARGRALDRSIGLILEKTLPNIREKVRKMESRKSALEAALERAPALFTKPKSRTLHGIKFGYKKQKGKVSFEDGDKVVARIHKLLPELAETLIKTTETPQKDALGNLPASDLKKLGVTVTEDGDVVFIKADDTDGEKLIRSLLNGKGD